MPLLVRFGLITNPVIEEIFLPLHTLKPGRAALPVADHYRHPGFTRKAKQSMHMIGHQQDQLAPPMTEIVITLGGFAQIA